MANDYEEYIVRVYKNKTEWLNKAFLLHRLNGPAVEHASGIKEWYINGVMGRDDGPAIEYNNGDKFWVKSGKYHRLDGPALEYANGTKGYYINGQVLSEKDFLEKTTKKDIPNCDGEVVEIRGQKYKLSVIK